MSGLEIREKQSVSQIFQSKSLDKQETWYPTLQKTVWVLSQLKDFVKVNGVLALSGSSQLNGTYSRLFSMTLRRKQSTTADRPSSVRPRR